MITQRWLVSIWLIVSVFFSSSVSANTVAVVDSRLAILNTESAKQTLTKLEDSVSTKRTRLNQVKEEMSLLEAEFQKNRSMADTEYKTQMQHKAHEKLEEYNQLAADIQRKIEDTQSELLTSLMPKFRAGVTHVRQQKHIDVVIEKKHVFFVDDAWDITRQVTEYIDQH